MTQRQEIIAQILQVPDDKYYNIDAKTIDAMQSRIMEINDFEGIVINGPQIIASELRGTIPILAALRCCVRRNYKTDFHENSFIVISDNISGQVECFKAFPPDEKERPMITVDHNDPVLSTMYSTIMEIIDLKQRVQVQWKQGSYGVSLICYDYCSNSIEMKKVESPERIPEKIGLIYPQPNPFSAETTRSWLFGKSPKKAYPSYENFKKIASPNDWGANFIMEIPQKTSDSLIIFCSFKTEAKLLNIPRERPIITLRDHQRTVKAIVPVTLLIVKNNMSKPLRQFNWMIPIYGNEKVEPGDTLEGHFAIDIMREYKDVLPPDMYMVYLVLDGIIFGPSPFEWCP